MAPAGGRQKRAFQHHHFSVSTPPGMAQYVCLYDVCFPFICCLGRESHNQWLGTAQPCWLRRCILMPFVYLITSELTAQDGNEMEIAPGSTVFAQMFIPAPSFQRALSVGSMAWSEQCYDFVDVLLSSRFNMENWNFEDYPETSSERHLCIEAINTGQVQYGVLVNNAA